MANLTRECKEKLNHAYPLTDFLERSPKSGLYCCPFCGSGHGPDRSGAFNFYPETNTGACFAGCKQDGEEAHYYDLIDVIGHERGLDFIETVKYISDLSGIPLEYESEYKPGGEKWEALKEKLSGPPEEPEKPNTPGRYKEFIEAAAAEVDRAKEYLHSRGISDETIKKYRLGFTIQYFQGAGEELPAVVFPYSPKCEYYFIRSLDGRFFYKPNTEEAGSEPLYNPGALRTEPAFVCESPLDALAVIEAGGAAVALGGTSWGKLWPLIDKTKTPLILCLDNDEPDSKGHRKGQEAQARLAKNLREDRLPFHNAKFSYDKYDGPKKDANDLLRSNPEQFKKDVAENIAIASDPTGIKSFLFDIQTKKYEPVPTGIKSIDKLLKGGLMSQTLTLLGSGPGGGKTTLAAQIFESMAAAGRESFYFNFEMSKDQLIARSLSRRIFIKHNHYKLTATDILQGYKISETQLQLVQEAAEEYINTVGNRLLYNPDNVGPGLNDFMKYLTEKADQAQREGRPAANVCIDYLHLIEGEPGEDITAILKRSMNELKEYAREYDAIVFAIMAQNREANKAKHATLQAARDTSNIEYGADLILQLYKPEGAGPNEVNLAVTKSRFSDTDFTGIPYTLHGGQSYIEPTGDKWKNPHKS